ncbi:hypothetical protein L596_009064 [Steinernema carpocapsae]|uniref:Uncharacterized protein n=1 Tax=Steinernema carpocapsae TaxID=34508 RepID=A0A4U5PEA8_STECR|nr:hypothetical protein L596_009064 [Steinernema carpocapsae]
MVVKQSWLNYVVIENVGGVERELLAKENSKKSISSLRDLTDLNANSNLYGLAEKVLKKVVALRRLLKVTLQIYEENDGLWSEMFEKNEVAGPGHLANMYCWLSNVLIIWS